MIRMTSDGNSTRFGRMFVRLLHSSLLLAKQKLSPPRTRSTQRVKWEP